MATFTDRLSISDLGVRLQHFWKQAHLSFLTFLPLPYLLLSNICLAGYAPPETWELCGGSDLIVDGTIMKVGEHVFELRINKVVAGKYDRDTLKIQKFEDWACGRRWTAYRDGQTALFCLRRDKGVFRTRFSVIGGGNEGELPTSGDWIYYGGDYGEDIGVEHEYHIIHGYPFYSQKRNKEDLIRSIRGFRNCFKITRDERKPWFHRDHLTVKQTRDGETTDQFANADPFNRFLIRSMDESLKELGRKFQHLQR